MSRGTDVEWWAEFNPPMQLICHDNFGKITNGMSTDIFSEMVNHWYFFFTDKIMWNTANWYLRTDIFSKS